MSVSLRRLPASDIDLVLEQTGEDVWMALKGARLFVTGGTGFFGKWLLETFAAAEDRFDLNASMTVLTRDSQSFAKKFPALYAHPAIQFYTGDVRSFEFPSGDFSHIIHAATDVSTSNNAHQALLTFDTITQGTRRTLEFAKQCGVSRFLLTSSGAIYGRQQPEVTHVTEDYIGAPDPLDPHTVYGEGKRYAETISVLYGRKYEFDVCIARCFAFIGPYLPLDAHFAAGNFLRDALRGGPIQVGGDGTPYRSYLYAADLIIWLWTLLVKGRTCRAYNIGSEEEVTIAQLAEITASVCGNVTVEIGKKATPGKLPERYVPSSRRAKEELNLKQNVVLQEAIVKTKNWHADCQ